MVCKLIQRSEVLSDSVRSHAIVGLTVAASGPHQQRCGHHLKRRCDERQIQRPAQRGIHMIWKHRHTVQQIHSG